MNNVEVLLDKLLKAVSFKFAEDKTSPGVTTSFLKDGSYYASVVRYDGSFANGKQVVCKARGVPGSTLEGVLKDLAIAFLALARHPNDPVQQLNSFVSSDQEDKSATPFCGRSY